MKSYLTGVKKIGVCSPEKKNCFNPYNDLPNGQADNLNVKSSHNKNKMSEKNQKLLQKKVQLAKSPLAKTNKLISPDGKVVGGHTISNNDSINKIKISLADQSKKLGNKKLVKNDKNYNDYFEVELNNKKLANTSNNSADSSKNSVKSLQLLMKKTNTNHKQIGKIEPKAAGNCKQFPLNIKNGLTFEQQTKKMDTGNINKVLNHLPIPKIGKNGDDRKSWSYTNLNTHTKTNSKDLYFSKNQLFSNIDLKNARSTAGNPGNPENIKNLQKNIISSVDLGMKSSSKNKKQTSGKFIPSASKSLSSESHDKNKKFNSSKLAASKQKVKDNQTQFYTYPKILQVGQTLVLKVINNEHTSRKAYFKVLKLIASEDKTSIYLVRESLTNFIYCLKKCQVVKNQQNILNCLDYLIRQAKVGLRLNHANIVKYYCTLVDGLHIYHLMQFIEGDNLYNKNKNQFCPSVISSMNEKVDNSFQKSQLSKFLNRMTGIKQALHSLLQAVCYIHQQNITHRDIKPANVLITHENNYKLGDFGTAVWSSSSQSIGTLDYAAPELISKTKYDNKVDIWSLGCIAYELYVGYPPFFNENRQITISNIRDCRYDLSLVQDQALLNLINRMLQKDPTQRITAVQALQNTFFNEIKLANQQI